jgi:phospholipase C
MGTNPSGLDTFDHVVVLMLENRSFDNILGYLYQGGVPSGKNFEGVAGKALTNPDAGGQLIPVSIGAEFHQPYPDPGEEFDHVTFQLFGPDQALGTPQMKGFVQDYYRTLQGLQNWHGSAAAQSLPIMKCFAPNSLPVLNGLAEGFAVFDHWFCAVPSQTWCNRAFWHAATSWGWVNNPPASASDPSNPWNLKHWAHSSTGSTLFDLIEHKFGPGRWHVYEDLAVPFTKLVHWGDLKDKIGEEYFRYLEGGHPFHNNFFDDCAMGVLPKYSFIEPHFINFFEDVLWHDDLHPSAFGSPVYSNGGPGSVLLGDQLVWKVYQAIRNSKSPSGNNWQNTLLIITFDEHGGCFDHIAPPSVVPPDTKGFNTGPGEEGFDFTRLGVRVPMVMVSAYIAKNTIVNSPMHHCSFLKTMEQKWGLQSLGPRQDAALPFTEVFAASLRTLDDWPDFEPYPGPSAALGTTLMRAVDSSTIPLNRLQASILDATQELCLKDPASVSMRPTSANALLLLNRVKSLRYPAR